MKWFPKMPFPCPRLRAVAARSSVRKASMFAAALIVVSGSSHLIGVAAFRAYLDRYDAAAADRFADHLADIEAYNDVIATLAAFEKVSALGPMQYRHDRVSGGRVPSHGASRVFLQRSYDFTGSEGHVRSIARFADDSTSVLHVSIAGPDYACRAVFQSTESFPDLEGMRVDATYEGGRKASMRIPPPSFTTPAFLDRTCAGSMRELEIDASDRVPAADAVGRAE